MGDPMIRRSGPLRVLRGCECTGLLVRLSALVGYPLVCFFFFFFFVVYFFSRPELVICATGFMCIYGI